MSFIYKILAIIVFILAVPQFTFAQESVSFESPEFLQNIQSAKDFDNLTPEQEKQVDKYFDSIQFSTRSSTPTPEGSVSCFDYYKFGSVQVDIIPTLNQTIPGVNLTFAGKITNDNTYPVVDGQVYVKIFYTGKNGDAFIPGQGYPLVDQFALPDTFAISAKGTKETSFSWKVPMNARDGEYMSAFFFQTAKRYNLLGLSFTDDVTGNQAPFSITSKNVQSISLDKSGVTLNNRPHIFTAFLPHFTKDEVIKTTIKITNSTNIESTVPVTWKLYSWDALREENLKDTKTEIITLKPNETKELSYEAQPNNISVSYLVVESNDQGSKSILDIRWVRDGVEETRINFPSITKYPLTEGESNTLFSCIHSTNEPLVKDNVLTLTLTDFQGEVLYSYKYQGDITGSMMGVKSDFIPTETLSNFTLTATLERGGKMIEEVTQSYSCSDLNPEFCPDTTDQSGLFDMESNSDAIGKVLLVVSLIVTMLIIVGLLILNFMKNKNQRKGGEALSIIFVLMISGIFLFGTPSGVEAKSVSANVNGIPLLAQDWDGVGESYSTDTVPLSTTAWGEKWLIGLEAGASASVIYGTRLFNNDTNDEIMDRASIPIGTNIRIERIPAQNSDIFWNGTGAAYDTPYGYWQTDAGPQAKACHAEDQTSYRLKTINGVTAPIISYTLLDVAPVAEQLLAPSSNLSCTGNICTVTGIGPISVNMLFPATYGRFYYRYLDHPEHYGGGCRANNVPMRVVTGCSSYFENCTSHGFQVEPNPYDVVIPESRIIFSLTATGPNTPPTAPTVTPASPKGGANNPITLSAVSSDADDDTLRYGFDWDNNGTVDEFAPSTGFVPSGISQSLSHSWPSDGTYTIQVRAEDNRGMFSSWTSKVITVTSVTATISGYGCIIPTEAVNCNGTLTWNILNASSPNIFNLTSGLQYSTDSNGSNSSQLLQRGANRILARDGSDTLNETTLTASCDSGAGDYWTGSKCAVTPKISIEPSSKVVRAGETTSIVIKITSNVDLPCTLLGTLTSPETFIHNDNSQEVTYPPYNTKPLYSDQIVRLTCDAVGTSIVKETRISVVGVMQEL